MTYDTKPSSFHELLRHSKGHIVKLETSALTLEGMLENVESDFIRIGSHFILIDKIEYFTIINGE